MIVNAVDGALGWALGLLPNVNIDLTDFIEKFTWLADMTKSLNYILPLQEALIFTGILLGIKFAMLLFWSAMRVINLLRGSG